MGTNPEDRRCCLVEAEGERWVESAGVCVLKCQNTETHSLNWRPGQNIVVIMGNGAIVCFGGRTKIGGHCYADVLVCGPTSSPEKAGEENIFILTF